MKKDARCIAVYGRRGSGKTTLVKGLVKSSNRLVVFDPMGEYARLSAFCRAVSVGGVLAYLKNGWRGGFRIAYDVPGQYLARLHALSELLWQAQAPYDAGVDARKLTLVVEEMNLAYPASGLARDQDAFTRLVLQGRHRGIEVVGVTQRPALVSPNFRGNVAETYVFPLEDEIDVAVMLRKIGRAREAELRALRDFHYLWLAQGRVEPGRVRARGSP